MRVGVRIAEQIHSFRWAGWRLLVTTAALLEGWMFHDGADLLLLLVLLAGRQRRHANACSKLAHTCCHSALKPGR